MSEYDDVVERQRLLLEAEEWSGKVACIHAHQISSMWYDTRPHDTIDSGVIDVEYNGGWIERTLNNGSKVIFGEKYEGDDLIQRYGSSLTR